MNSEAHSESPLKRTERLKEYNLQPVSTGFGYEPCDFSPRWIKNGVSSIGNLIGNLMVGNHLKRIEINSQFLEFGGEAIGTLFFLLSAFITREE
jgi:hypothetical protein